MADDPTSPSYSYPEAGPSRLRPNAPYVGLPKLSKPFILNDALTRNYKTQYANIYFLRLLQLRPVVAKVATERWGGLKEKPQLLKNILKVESGQLCFVIGTIYMEMPLKPNVLEDMGRDHWIAPPPPRAKFFSPQDVVHLEDESGRITLVGDRMRSEFDMPGGGLVTGVVMAVLGMETASGDFEVIDLCYAGLPPLAQPSSHGSSQPPVDRKPLTESSKAKGKAKQEDTDAEDPPVNTGTLARSNGKGKIRAEDEDLKSESQGAQGKRDPVWVALVSGVSAGAADVPEDFRAQLLAEWLMGEAGGMQDQLDGSRVSRIIFAGNSLSPPVRNESDNKPRRYGYDASLYTPHPTQVLDDLIFDLMSAGLSVHVVPGGEDPVGVTLPQQPFPRAMLKNSSMAGGEGLRMETNPCWMELGGKSFLGTGGQTLDDMYKYLSTPSDDRLSMAKRTLEWRHLAPTAPDTLWCFPFADKDPFLIERRPHVYFLGNQPEFRSGLVGDPSAPTRIILLPRFSSTGLLCLVDISSPLLPVRTIEIVIPEWEKDTKAGKGEMGMTEEEAEEERERRKVVIGDLDMMVDDEAW